MASVVDIDKLKDFKDRGLCFKDITSKEIIVCIVSSSDFLRNYSGVHYIEPKDLYITIESSEVEPFYPRGLLQMKFFESYEDVKGDLYIGYIRFCAHNKKIYIGNIQTSTYREKISNISKRYKMSVLRLMFKTLCIFFKQRSYIQIELTSTNNRVALDRDTTLKLKTDYDTLFKEFGCVLDAGRWKFSLQY